MSEQWDHKRQLGELVGELRGMTTGRSLSMAGNVKVGVIAMGRGRASRERRFVVVAGEHREFYRSASEAAVAAMNISRDKAPS